MENKIIELYSGKYEIRERITRLAFLLWDKDYISLSGIFKCDTPEYYKFYRDLKVVESVLKDLKNGK